MAAVKSSESRKNAAEFPAVYIKFRLNLRNLMRLRRCTTEQKKVCQIPGIYTRKLAVLRIFSPHSSSTKDIYTANHHNCGVYIPQSNFKIAASIEKLSIFCTASARF